MAVPHRIRRKASNYWYFSQYPRFLRVSLQWYVANCIECERLKRVFLESSVECVNAESELVSFARRKSIRENDGLTLNELQGRLTSSRLAKVQAEAKMLHHVTTHGDAPQTRSATH